MNAKLKNKIKRALNEELVKRLLIKYFKDKGIEESLVYPPAVFDLPYRIPELLNSVEVVPFVEQLDPMTNIVTVGWNLFVLGTNRMYMGSSTHANLMEFRRSVMGNVQANISRERKKSAAQVVEFIMNIVGRNKDALMDVPPGAQMPTVSQLMPSMAGRKPKLGPTMSGSFYEKNRPVF
jgi:hypothetical protein